MVLTSADSPGTFKSPIPVTVLFSKPVTGFTASDVSVGNATLENFEGSGDRYAFDLIPAGIGPVTAMVGAGAARDAAGNANIASNAFSRVFEVAPVARLYSPAGASTTSTDVPIYVQFNEPVRLGASGITVVQGTIADTLTQVSPTTFLFHVTPTLPSGQHSTTVTVTLLQLAATDAFGNSNQLPEKYEFTYSDYAPVQATFTTLVSQGPYNQLQVKFNQTVTGFDATKIVVPNARVWGFSGSGDTYLFWVTALPTPAEYGQPLTLNLTIPPGVRDRPRRHPDGDPGGGSDLRRDRHRPDGGPHLGPDPRSMDQRHDPDECHVLGGGHRLHGE